MAVHFVADQLARHFADAQNQLEGEALIEQPLEGLDRLILEMRDAHGGPGRDMREGRAASRGQLAGRGRNRIAVRVIQRMTHASREPLRFIRTQLMLAPLGLPVPLGGARSGPIGEESLEQPVGAKDAQGVRAAFLREGEAILPRDDQSERFGALQDFERLAARGFQHTGQALERPGDATRLAVVEMLERVFHPDPFAQKREAGRGAQECPFVARTWRRAGQPGRRRPGG